MNFIWFTHYFSILGDLIQLDEATQQFWTFFNSFKGHIC